MAIATQIGYKGCLSIYDKVEKYGLEVAQQMVRGQYSKKQVESVHILIRNKKLREECLFIPNFYS
jgi:hypothetical protein